MISKKPAIFGSMQPRFPALKLKDIKPGPGGDALKAYVERNKKKQQRNLRDPANRSYSLYQLR